LYKLTTPKPKSSTITYMQLIEYHLVEISRAYPVFSNRRPQLKDGSIGKPELVKVPCVEVNVFLPFGSNQMQEEEVIHLGFKHLGGELLTLPLRAKFEATRNSRRLKIFQLKAAKSLGLITDSYYRNLIPLVDAMLIEQYTFKCTNIEGGCIVSCYFYPCKYGITDAQMAVSLDKFIKDDEGKIKCDAGERCTGWLEYDTGVPMTRELNELILQGDPFAELDVDTILGILQWLVLDPDSGDALSNAFVTSRSLKQASRELVDSGLWPEFRVAPIAAWLRTILEADQVPRTEACPFICVPASFCSAHPSAAGAQVARKNHKVAGSGVQEMDRKRCTLIGAL